MRRLAWKQAYKGLLPDAVIEQATQPSPTPASLRTFGQLSEAIMNSRLSLMAHTDSGQVLGFAAGGLSRQETPGIDCELWAIYVHPDFQGRGVGRALHETFLAAMKSRGHKNMILWVLKDNSPSRHFYERIGGSLHPDIKPFHWDGAYIADEVGYVWEL